MANWSEVVRVFSPSSPINRDGVADTIAQGAVAVEEAVDGTVEAQEAVAGQDPVTPVEEVADVAEAPVDDVVADQPARVPAAELHQMLAAAVAPATPFVPAPAPAEQIAEVATGLEDGAVRDRFDDLGAHVAEILRATTQAREAIESDAVSEMDARKAAFDAELEALREATEAELARRRQEMDEQEQALELRIQAADAELASKAAAAAEQAAEQERTLAGMREAAEARFAQLLSMQDSLREQLDSAATSLRGSLSALTSEPGSV
jgi:hypothetical protein